MQTLIVIRKDSYFDSVFLMRISREAKGGKGVSDAAAAMATPSNKGWLTGAGYASADLDAAGPNDLVIAVRAEDGADLESLRKNIEAMLKSGSAVPPGAPGCGDNGGGDGDGTGPANRPQSLAAALEFAPESNLVLISVPGIYAAREARRALERGLHVMLFSDNVSIDDELALKQEAVKRGLLLMGPDCGTAIINGKPLAFANKVRRGNIGIVGASGTGIQEISCCIHKIGGGISQAIGVGGRDLSAQIGGLMMIQGIEALAADPQTEVIVAVSKPPSPEVAARVIEALRRANKPAVVHFIGAPPRESYAQIAYADSLAGAAELACKLAKIPTAPRKKSNAAANALLESAAKSLSPSSRFLGLFCGGTTAYEALTLLERAGESIHSNLHAGHGFSSPSSPPAKGHCLLDLGADEFTSGRPHPMIEPELRNERLLLEIENPQTAILLFDVVLGYGSHENPAGVLVEGLEKARGKAQAQSGGNQNSSSLIAIASITGTPEDIQDSNAQRRILEQAQVIVLPDNCQAAKFAQSLLRRLHA